MTHPTVPVLICGVTLAVLLGALEAVVQLTTGTALDRVAEYVARR